ncbi:MAG: dolichyl-phosphate beta-glucosyltransferase [Candidatus Dormibacteria bacterium]
MTDPTPPRLSVVVPAYNEARRLPPSLRVIDAYLRAEGHRGELIVVDDGSSDGTSDLVEGLAAEGLNVRLLRHQSNRGKGAAVRTGVMAAAGDVVLFTDADLSTPIEDVDLLLSAIESGAHVAIGSRAVDRSLTSVHQPWLRDRAGRVFNLFVQVILLPGLKDTQCGFKAFRGGIAQELFAATETDGFEFDTEVLYRARRRGLVTREIAVHWRDSPDSRVNALLDSPRMLLGLFRIRRLVR